MRDETLDYVALVLGIDPSTLPRGDYRAREAVESAAAEEIMENNDLSEEEFQLLRPHLAPEPRSSKAILNKDVLDALLWCRATRRALTHLPVRYGSAEAIRKRSERWAIAGVWDRLCNALPDLGLPERRRADLQRLCLAYGRRGERIRGERQNTKS